MTTLDGPVPRTDSSPVRRPWHQRPVLAGLLLFSVYVGLSFLNDPRGYLGTDTGIKVGTYRAMEALGTGRPVIGYWAGELDPEGRAHPFWATYVVDGEFFDVTTLPMVLAAYPLWRVGGYRLALVLPMAGAVAAALVARGIARRVGGPADGWPAFWLAGLASPLAIYALDLWEHSIGVAAMAGATLVLFDAVDRWAFWRGALAGALFGLAFSMRTEALVYLFTGFVVISAVLLAARRTRHFLILGAGGVAGFAVLALANAGLESVVLGGTIRSGRASGTAAVVGSALGLRAQEALVTLTSPFPGYSWDFVALGLIGAVGLVALAAWGTRRATMARAAMVTALLGLVVFWRLAAGVGFWPGLLATTPLAAVALAHGRQPTDRRRMVLLGVVPLPLVFLSQYTGGALPQWGGRYILTSGLILGAVGAACLPSLLPWVRGVFIGLAVLATGMGLVWLSVRSRQVGDALESVRARSEDVLIWPDPFLSREFADMYGEQRWLAANGPDDRAAAIDVARRVNPGTLGLVSVVGDGDPAPDPPSIPGFHLTGQSTSPFISPWHLNVASYAADH